MQLVLLITSFTSADSIHCGPKTVFLHSQLQIHNFRSKILFLIHHWLNPQMLPAGCNSVFGESKVVCIFSTGQWWAPLTTALFKGQQYYKIKLLFRPHCLYSSINYATSWFNHSIEYLSLSTFHLKCLYFILFTQVFYGLLIMTPPSNSCCSSLNHSGLSFYVLVTSEQKAAIFCYRSIQIFLFHAQGLLTNVARLLHSSLSLFLCFSQWVEFFICSASI